MVLRNILKEIYWNSKENVATLAEKLNTTIDIVRNRMQSMIRDKIIISYN